MEKLGQTILSIIIAAMICGIATAFVPSESGKARIRLLSGLIVTIMIIQPLSTLRDMDLYTLDPGTWIDGQSISARGEELSQASMEAIIKEKCEAYILDKASTLGVCLTVEVSLSGDEIPVPASVTLQGDISPVLRLKLEAMILEDMGITKENLRWKE